MSGDGVMKTLQMVVLLGVHGADDGQLVHLPGSSGKQLRDLDSIHASGDGLKRAVGLGVPGVDLAGAAIEPDQDAGLSLSRSPGRCPQGPLERQVAVQANAQEAQGAQA